MDETELRMSHELAILNTIGTVSSKLAGETSDCWARSQQIMCECDDVYAKLTKYQPTITVKKKCSSEELEQLWSKKVDLGAHNRNQGLHVNLSLMDRFGGPKAHRTGKFTESGVTVGECKLFSTLHALVMIDETVLQDYPGLSAFYGRFGDSKATRAVVETGANMPAAFKQYFITR